MQHRDERSIGELFADLASETSTLVRQEVTLAKVEMTQKASEAGKDVGFLAAGGAVAYAGLLVILAGIVLVLGNLIPLWLSALFVGVVVALIGYFLVRSGLNRLKQVNPAPQETIQTVKEDKEWIQNQTK